MIKSDDEALKDYREELVKENTNYFKNWILKIKLNQDDKSSWNRISINNSDLVVFVCYKPHRDYSSTTICCVVEKAKQNVIFKEELTKALNTILRKKEECLSPPKKHAVSHDLGKDKLRDVFWK